MTGDIDRFHRGNHGDDTISTCLKRTDLSTDHVVRTRGRTTLLPTSTMILLLLSVLVGTSSVTVAAVPTEPPARTVPMVCNNGTDHRCVCGPEKPAVPLDNSPVNCEQLIQARELPVVDMRARHVNLEALLHTNENYENYFKRRVAQIVSAYCERQVNECPGVALRLQQGEDARIADANSVVYSRDDSEPLLTQDNVVLLRVEREPGNVTRILFAVTKSDKLDSLGDSDIIDPVKVKVILGSQAVPLSRILGGIKLESVRVSRIRRNLTPKDTDNSTLIKLVIAVAAFFIACYIIGGIRIYRNCRAQSEKRKAEEGLAATTTVPNYGTLPSKHDDKQQQQPATRNGSALGNHHNQNHNAEQPTYKQYQKIDETVSAVTTTTSPLIPPPHREDLDDPPVLTDRQARFMFMCDASQLPREPTFESQSDLPITDSAKSTPPRDETIEEEPELPALVVESSMSMLADTPTLSLDSPETVIPKERLLSGSHSPPLGRPRSRRGSRVDEEEIDMTELGAMGDNHQQKKQQQQQQQEQMPMFTDLVIPDGIGLEERPQSADRWSSSEGEVDVYYKLSDDDEVKGDNWDRLKGRNEEREEDDDSEMEEEPPGEQPEESKETDAFVYERLREDAASPMPPRKEEEA